MIESRIADLDEGDTFRTMLTNRLGVILRRNNVGAVSVTLDALPGSAIAKRGGGFEAKCVSEQLMVYVE
jgi:hypothetical protein